MVRRRDTTVTRITNGMLRMLKEEEQRLNMEAKNKGLSKRIRRIHVEEIMLKNVQRNPNIRDELFKHKIRCRRRRI